MTSVITATATFNRFLYQGTYRNPSITVTLDASWIGCKGIKAVGVYSYEKWNKGKWEMRYGHIDVACTAQ